MLAVGLGWPAARTRPEPDPNPTRTRPRFKGMLGYYPDRDRRLQGNLISRFSRIPKKRQKKARTSRAKGYPSVYLVHT